MSDSKDPTVWLSIGEWVKQQCERLDQWQRKQPKDKDEQEDRTAFLGFIIAGVLYFMGTPFIMAVITGFVIVFMLTHRPSN